MTSLLPWCNLMLALPGLWIVFRLRSIRSESLRGTTLVGPSRWLQLSLLIWVAAQTLALPACGLSAGVISRSQMFALSLLLAPYVSVLGAKRPGARVWDVFIVLPMLIVLNWPAWAGLIRGSIHDPIDLEGPATLGVGVVLLLTLGNYFGTCFTSAALVSLAGIAIGWTELSTLLPKVGSNPFLLRMVVSLGLWSGFALAVRNRTIDRRSRAGLVAVWLDVRDWFGILWARRLAERINQTARQEHWPLDVGLDGLHWREPVDEAARTQTLSRLEQTLRWLLRRFVDDEWIDQRLRGEGGMTNDEIRMSNQIRMTE